MALANKTSALREAMSSFIEPRRFGEAEYAGMAFVEATLK